MICRIDKIGKSNLTTSLCWEFNNFHRTPHVTLPINIDIYGIYIFFKGINGTPKNSVCR